MKHPLNLPLAAALTLVASATPAALAIDSPHSTVAATFTQMNVAVEAPFSQVLGSIQFDPAQPQKASAKLEVLTASIDLGSDDYNSEAAKPEWLASKAHPRAAFASTVLKPLGGNRYQASGALVLKGKVLQLSFPVTLSAQPAAYTFDGSFALSRKALGIGDPAWNDVLADAVTVKFHLVQPR